MCLSLMQLFTTHGRVLFSYVRHYLWMCVMGELLLSPRLQISTHVQYRARLESVPELPLCLAPCFGICLSFRAMSSYWFLVPLHLHLLTQTEIALFSYFILHFFSGMPGMGSLEPEPLLALLSTAKHRKRMRRGWVLHFPDYTMGH